MTYKFTAPSGICFNLSNGAAESMSDFNEELWDERFDNIKSAVDKIERTVADLSKLMVLTIIGITGWALVQLYAQLMTHANAAVIPAVAKALIK